MNNQIILTWTLDDIKEVLDEVSSEMGLELTVPIIISKRMTKELGKFNFKLQKDNIVPVALTFSESLLYGYSHETVRLIIIHTYLHYYTNVTENKNCGCNPVFLGNCIKAGVKPEKTVPLISYKREKILNNNTIPYNVLCSKCSKIVARRHKYDRRLLDNKVSQCCKSRLVYVNNFDDELLEN